MWTRPSRNPTNVNENAFQANLFEAYNDMHAALANSSSLVTAGHLWTEHASDAQALAPLAAYYGDRGKPVYVHTNADLRAHTALQPPDLKAMLTRLQSMPATENIGLRADIERMVYGIVYQAEHPPSAHQVNVHLDVDALKELGRGPGDPALAHQASLHQPTFGFAAPADRNDLLFMRPGDPQAIRVAAKMLHVLQNGSYPLDAGAPPAITEMRDQWTNGTRFLTGLLKSIAGNPSLNGGQVTAVDMMKQFMRADHLCKQRGQVQQRVDALLVELRQTTPSSPRAAQIHAQIVGIGEVFRSSAQMIESYVNLCVYLPQIEHAHRGGAQAADTMFKSMFGKSLPPAGADGWRAGTLNVPEGMDAQSLAPHELENALREGFSQLRHLVPSMPL
ncbi:MAG: hypothetical protein V4754_19785 [Pseudomonadota bacterium]